MTLTFLLTAEDWRAFRDHHVRSDPKVRRIRGTSYVGAAVLLAALPGVLFLGGNDLLFRAAGLVALSIVWFVAFQRWAATAAAWLVNVLDRQGTNVRYEGVHVVKVQIAGIEHKYQVTENTLSWTDVQRVENTPDYLFLYDGPATAVIIPRAKLSSQSDFDSCVKLARDCFARASRSPAGNPRE